MHGELLHAIAEIHQTEMPRTDELSAGSDEQLPATFKHVDAIVIQPIIKTKGIFSEGGRAEVWLSDDANRIMLQMKSKLSFGSLNLYLKSYQRGTAPAPERSPSSSTP